jgi:hypothetical protein
VNPGLLLLPYLAVLGWIVLRAPAWSAGLWLALWVCGHTIRNRFGTLSIYWSDLASIAMVLQVLAHRRPPMRGRGLLPLIADGRGAAGACATGWALWISFAIAMVPGLLAAALRYGEIIGPLYLAGRMCLGALSLALIGRLASDASALRWLSWSALGCCALMATCALYQAASPDNARAVEDFFFGSFIDPSTSIRVRNIDQWEESDLRIYRVGAMYGASTCFAGASLLTGTLCWLLNEMRGKRLAGMSGLGMASIASLLTISRHSALALVALLLTAFVCGIRASRALVVGGLAFAVLVYAVLPSEGWQRRLAKGGVAEDDNLASRLVDRPREFASRVADDPAVLIAGTGIGIDYFLKGSEFEAANFGFVSNTFVLFVFFQGLAALVVVACIFGWGLRRAAMLDRHRRALFVAIIACTGVVMASDNYGYFHCSVIFLWAAPFGLLAGIRTESAPLPLLAAVMRLRLARSPAGPLRASA